MPALDQRLDARLDEMVQVGPPSRRWREGLRRHSDPRKGDRSLGDTVGRQNGMADELDELWRLARQLDAAGTDYRGRGLYQAIGTRWPRSGGNGCLGLADITLPGALPCTRQATRSFCLIWTPGTAPGQPTPWTPCSSTAGHRGASYRRACSRPTIAAVCASLGQIRRGARQDQHAPVCAASGLMDPAAPVAGGRRRRHAGATAPALPDAAGG